VKLAQVLHEATEALQAAGIEDAWLEAEVLLRHTLRLDRAHLYARLHEDLSTGDQAAFHSFLARRLAHEPTAYIVGQREFYGLDLETTPAALIPRPETELLVEEAIARACLPERQAPYSERLLIVDVGTGNGAIAVALAVHLPQAAPRRAPVRALVAIDLSRQALALAIRNARRYGVESRVSFLQADLLAPLAQATDLIVANLPYVRSADWEALPPEIREHEPRAALDGGPDGLREIERLLGQAPSYLRPGGSLLVEMSPLQATPALALARRYFPGAAVRILRDAAGLDRLLVIDTPSS
jgi:release factor glutamine methyltransferase